MSAEDFTEAVEGIGGLFTELVGKTCKKLDNMEAPEQFGGILAGLFGQTVQRLNNMPALGRLLDDSPKPKQQTSKSSVTPYEEPEPPVGEVLAIVDNTPYGSDDRTVLTANTNPTHSRQIEFNNQPNSPHHQNPIHSQQNEFNYQQNPTHQENVYQNQMSNQQQYNIVNPSPNVTVNVVVGGYQIPHPMYQHEPSSHPAASSNPSSTNFKPRNGRWLPKSPYEIESSPRGIVVIFNYYFDGQGVNQRDGAAADYQNLKNVFTNMDYEVWPEYIDLTKQETLEKLDEIRSSQRLALVDSFSTFFLSHGGDFPDSFRTVDEKFISVSEIIYTKFTDSNCPQLRRKPKLFFFNFCRGETEQLQRDFWKPNSSSAIAPRHVAVIQAALPHFEAKRDTQTGTVFVNCLCEVLRESANSLELHDIVQNTSELMQKRGGTTATNSYMDFGKFYFL